MGATGSVERQRNSKQTPGSNDEVKQLDAIYPIDAKSAVFDDWSEEKMKDASAEDLREGFRKLQLKYLVLKGDADNLTSLVAKLSAQREKLEMANSEYQEENFKLKNRGIDFLDQSGNGTKTLATHRNSRTNSSGGDDIVRKTSFARLVANQNDEATQCADAERVAALCTCAVAGDIEELQLLIDGGVDVNLADYDKRTALHLASEEGNLEVVQLLVEHGAEVNCKDRWGGTPLRISLTNVHNDVANFLKEKGAYKDGGLVKTNADLKQIANDRGRAVKTFIFNAEKFCNLPDGCPIPVIGFCFYLYKEMGISVVNNQLLLREINNISVSSHILDLRQEQSDAISSWQDVRQVRETVENSDLSEDNTTFYEVVKVFEQDTSLVIAQELFKDTLLGATTTSRKITRVRSLAKLSFGNAAIPNWASFTAIVAEICDDVLQGPNEGANAKYIPNLDEQHVDPNTFSVSICTVDGQIYSYGDESNFTLQSCGKPFCYASALEQNGETYVHSYVGREPSGRQFHDFELTDGKPFNAVTSAGAMVTASLIYPKLSPEERLKKYMELLTVMAGDKPVTIDEDVYQSEKATAFRNYALSNLLMAEGCFPASVRAHKDLAREINLYLRMCSVSMNAESLATTAATLANWGVCPLTGKRAMCWDTVKATLQLCYSCGMYTYSGEWACSIGIPAKSGVSGAVYLVVPGVLGLVVRSPRLDEAGNSVRGRIFAKKFAEKFKWSIMDLTYRAKDT